MSNHYNFDLPLNFQFSEYIYYEKMILPHEVERIRNFWEDDKTIKATISGESKYNDELRQSSVMFIENSESNKWIYDRLAMVCTKTNAERYGFDLRGFNQELQLTRYSEGNFFNWHLDFGVGEISGRKLSITVQLSDPDEYEGGDLQFMINDKVVNAPRTKGTIIVFPSFIMHRVTPITKGVRQSIVGWVSGPPYR